MSMTETSKKAENLMELHRAAEASWATFSYAKPDGVSSGKGFVALGRKDIVRGVVKLHQVFVFFGRVGRSHRCFPPCFLSRST